VLELDDVAGYLLDRGLVEPAAIVDGGFTVADLSRRNRVFVATAEVGRCFVLKVAAPEQRHAVAREAAVLARLRDAATGHRLLAHMPEIAVDDRAQGVLVLETTAGAHDLLHHHERHARGRFSRALAATPAGCSPTCMRCRRPCSTACPAGSRVAGDCAYTGRRSMPSAMRAPRRSSSCGSSRASGGKSWRSPLDGTCYNL
jgi:hypothetical protein